MPLVKPAWPVLQRGDALSRGLLFSFPLHSPDWRETVRNQAVAATNGLTLSNSPLGAGAKTSGGSTDYASVLYNAQPPRVWCVEILAYINSTAAGFLCGWTNASNGNGAEYDRTVYVGTNGNFGSQLYDGASTQQVIGSPVVAGKVTSIIVTCDAGGGTGNLKIYCDYKLINTTVIANGGYQSYSAGPYFVLGRAGQASGFQAAVAFDGTLLMVNFAANVSVWTDAEIAQKQFDPFSIYRPKRRVSWFTVSGGTGTQNLAPSLFTNTPTFFSPTVGGGAVNLAPSLFTNTSTFFSPTVSSVADLAPSLFTNSNTFFSPTVVTAGNLAPALFTNTSTFFSPTVGRGVVNLAPTLFANSNIFYSPTVAVAQPQALLPSLYTSPNTFFLPVVHSHIVLVNVYVKLLAPHVFSAQEYPTDTIFGPDQSTIPADFQYTPLMEGLSGDSVSAIAQVNIDVFGRYDAHGNLLDNPPIPRPIYDPQPTPAVGDKHFLPLGNGSWP